MKKCNPDASAGPWFSDSVQECLAPSYSFGEFLCSMAPWLALLLMCLYAWFLFFFASIRLSTESSYFPRCQSKPPSFTCARVSSLIKVRALVGRPSASYNGVSLACLQRVSGCQSRTGSSKYLSSPSREGVLKAVWGRGLQVYDKLMHSSPIGWHQGEVSDINNLVLTSLMSMCLWSAVSIWWESVPVKTTSKCVSSVLSVSFRELEVLWFRPVVDFFL